MNVRHSQPAEMRRRRCGKCFHAIADNQNDIGFQFRECPCHQRRRGAGVLRGGHAVATGVGGPGGDSIDFEAGLADCS
jgi:hypothetical protein